MEKIRVGIVGCGGIANGKHMPAMKKVGTFEFLAFCDLIEEKAIKAKAQYGTEASKIYVDYKELLKEDLDAVYVLTHNSAHAPIAIDALNSGHHVMCEKPMATSYAEAKAMVDAAKANGKLLTVGYQSRYRDDAGYIKELCEADELGEIYYAKAMALRRRGVPTWGVFLDEEKQGGGPLIDIATHSLDLTLWLMDNYEPYSVTGSVYRKLADQTETGNCWGDWDPEKFTVEDSAFGFVKMKNGATIQVETSWALNVAEEETGMTMLCGTKAGADMKDSARINGVRRGRKYIEKPSLEGSNIQWADGWEGTTFDCSDLEQLTFYNAITKGTPLMVKPEQAMVVTQILEAIYISAKENRTIYFE